VDKSPSRCICRHGLRSCVDLHVSGDFDSTRRCTTWRNAGEMDGLRPS
jgi:hypothetical protein